MSIKNVGENILVKPGLFQCRYEGENYEILLHYVEKGTLLEKHSHLYAQMGYCFDGKFEFIFDDQEVEIINGMAYCLKSNVEHMAKSNFDYYSLDYKYIDSKLDIWIDISKIFKTNASYKYKQFSNSVVCRLETDGNREVIQFLDLSYNIFIVVKNKALVNNTKLACMNVYKLEETSNITIEANEELLILLIKK